jgi:branched-chain amino acid aminotransferase
MGVSLDKLDGVVWFDGKLVRWNEANVHVLTHGLIWPGSAESK